jgi:hypothetical protein
MRSSIFCKYTYVRSRALTQLFARVSVMSITRKRRDGVGAIDARDSRKGHRCSGNIQRFVEDVRWRFCSALAARLRRGVILLLVELHHVSCHFSLRACWTPPGAVRRVVRYSGVVPHGINFLLHAYCTEVQNCGRRSRACIFKAAQRRGRCAGALLSLGRAAITRSVILKLNFCSGGSHTRTNTLTAARSGV